MDPFSAKSTIPALPLEIILSIIQFALPTTPTFANLPLTYSHLLAFSLVCKSWRLLSQRLLYSHVLLSSPVDAVRFLRSATAELANMTISLRMGGRGVEVRGRENVQVMCSVLNIVRNLKEVWLMDMAPVSLAFFSGCTKLTAFHGSGIKVLEPYSRQTPYILPHLTSFGLFQSWVAIVDDTTSSSSPDLHPIHPSFFWSKALPPLQELAICQSMMLDQGLNELSLDLYGDTGERERNRELTNLLLLDQSNTESSAMAWRERLISMPNLRKLAIDNTYYLPLYLSSISSLPSPPYLTAIRFLSFTENDNNILAIVTSNYESLKYLKKVVVLPWELGLEPSKRKELRAACMVRGIELQQAGTREGIWEGFWDCW